MRVLQVFLDFDHQALVVVPAMAAGAMGQLGLAAVVADRRGGGRQRVMGPPLVTAGLGMASFRVRHNQASRVFVLSIFGVEPALESREPRPARLYRLLLASGGTMTR